MSQSIMFPRGGKPGVKYRTMLLKIVNLIDATYDEATDNIEEIMDHISHDLIHRNDLPWDGVSR